MLSCVITSPSTTATSSSNPLAAGWVALRLNRARTADSSISPFKRASRVLRNGVEQSVYERAFLLVVKGVRDVDIFGDDRTDRHVGARQQFVGAGSKDRPHWPVEAVERPTIRKARGNLSVDLV